ncbi:MAG: hypothetical protein RLZZ58_1463 [Pseudomonadota bacterium]
MQHLGPHVDWLRAQVAAGTLRASGPVADAAVKRAMLIVATENRAAAEAMIATDPFAIHGQIADLRIVEWDPIFGAFNADSTMPV